MSKTEHRSAGVAAQFVLAFGLIVLLARDARAAAGGPISGINTTTPYLIYYGNWTTPLVNYARTNYRVVILHPSSNITSNQIATIRAGKDNILGTADDVLVLAYLSVGEDDRIGVPLADDGLGPRVDPRSSPNQPLSSITNVIGLPSAGGLGYGSYYLNATGNQTGKPDEDGAYGSYYVNAGAPAWWNVIKNMTKAGSGCAGLDEILTANVGNRYNCDGVFLDTIDTAGPDTWGLDYEWTSPGMQSLVERIRTNYAGKVIMANRGLFYYDPNQKTYPYTLRPYIDMEMFESYFSDTSTNAIALDFTANKYDYAPKLNAEAGRPDGFAVFVVDYDHAPPQTAAVINQDYVESMAVQGWPLYRQNPALTETPDTNAAAWIAANTDTVPPVWDSTTSTSGAPSAPRVGAQEVIAGNHSATVFWDVARDQTEPVRYNVYYSPGPAMNFQTATKLARVAPGIPTNYNVATGPGIYPYCCTITGLTNGLAYFFAVRAEDSAVPSHEDTNNVSIAAVPGTSGATGTYASITIDGAFSDWAGIPWAYQGSMDTNPVNFEAVQFANDSNYFYGHFLLYSASAPFSDYNTHVFFNTGARGAAGYPVTGVLFDSDMMVEAGSGYDERNGSFNAGNVAGLNWEIAPAGPAAEFEFRVSLASTYADGTKVFGASTLLVLMQDDRGPESAVETGIPYTLAAPALGALFIGKFGTQVTITWSGPGILQSSASLTNGWANVLNATNPWTIQPGLTEQFFRLAE